MAVAQSTIRRLPAPNAAAYGRDDVAALWDAARITRSAGNDNGPGTKQDRWALLILRLAPISEPMAIYARQCRIDGWDVDAWCEMAIGVFRERGVN